MDMYISQEQFCMKILKQKTGTQDRDSHFVRACAVEMNMDISQNQFHARICREKPGPKIGTHTLRKRAQSKWTCTSHKKKCRNSQSKKRGPKLRRTLCASLRSRNAYGYRTKPLLCEHLQQRCHAPKSVPWSSPGLNTCRKNPLHTPWCPQRPPPQRSTSTRGQT